MPVEKLQNDESGGRESPTPDAIQQNNQNQNQEFADSLKSPTSPAGKAGWFKKNKLSRSDLKKLDTNDPFRFQGDGVDFRAKLIGIRDVEEPRGDQMCHEAMQLAKTIIRTSGQHKKKIVVTVSLNGLKIKDLSSGQDLHTFPVQKISFIARDVTDHRAFGFVFGTPESKHRFYAIKTEKAAQDVVLSIRDMFNIVYEMKKKQIEIAKQKEPESESAKSEKPAVLTSQSPSSDATAAPKIADLLDLESELRTLESGMNQMDEDWDAFTSDRVPEAQTNGQTPQGDSSYNTVASSGSANTESLFGDSFSTASDAGFSMGSGPPVDQKDAFGMPMIAPPSSSSSGSRASRRESHGLSDLSGDMFASPNPPTQNASPFAINAAQPSNPFLMTGGNQAPPAVPTNDYSALNVLSMASGPALFPPVASQTSAPMSNDPFDTSGISQMVLGGKHTSTPMPNRQPYGVQQPPGASFGDITAISTGSTSAFGSSGAPPQGMQSSFGAIDSSTGSVFGQGGVGTPSSMLNNGFYNGTSLASAGAMSPFDSPLQPERTGGAAAVALNSNAPGMARSNSPSVGDFKKAMEKPKTMDSAFDSLCNIDNLGFGASKPPALANPLSNTKPDPFAPKVHRKSINEIKAEHHLSMMPSGTPARASPLFFTQGPIPDTSFAPMPAPQASSQPLFMPPQSMMMPQQQQNPAANPFGGPSMNGGGMGGVGVMSPQVPAMAPPAGRPNIALPRPQPATAMPRPAATVGGGSGDPFNDDFFK